MPKTKFTPGPWDKPDFEESGLYGSIAIEKEGACLASVFNVEDFPCLEADRYHEIQQESWANANLIAAAPDLYEALAECLERGGTTRGEWMPQDTYNKARAALAKARGEQ